MTPPDDAPELVEVVPIDSDEQADVYRVRLGRDVWIVADKADGRHILRMN
jgi:hypothetical protein